jgi:hypothetical protein
MEHVQMQVDSMVTKPRQKFKRKGREMQGHFAPLLMLVFSVVLLESVVMSSRQRQIMALSVMRNMCMITCSFSKNTASALVEVVKAWKKKEFHLVHNQFLKLFSLNILLHPEHERKEKRR